MAHSATYQLSKAFAPPKVDLRKARLIDDRGRTENASVPISHRDPYDVTRSQLEYYFDVFGFMEPGDVLFYAFAVCRFAEESDEVPIFLERWLDGVDTRMSDLTRVCMPEHTKSLQTLFAGMSELIHDFQLASIIQFMNHPSSDE